MLPTRIRDSSWENDANLMESLEDCVAKRWSRDDIVSVMKSTYPQYAWSFSTLKRRLKVFGIQYIDKSVTDAQVGEAVAMEVINAGGDLGFRAMTAKLREKHKLKVPERDVLQALHEIDPQGVERRGDVGVGKKKKRKETFVSLVSQLKSMMMS